MDITLRFIEKFEKASRIDLRLFLSNYVFFFEEILPEVLSFYAGSQSEIDSSKLEFLDTLKEDVNDILNFIAVNERIFDRYEDWENTEYLEDIRERILLTKRSWKFLRSSRGKRGFSNKIQFGYEAGRYETLESIARKKLDSEDFDNEWSKIAIENDLSETDYDLVGSTSLELNKLLEFNNLKLQSVVDSMEGENFYGKDVARLLEFTDSDLRVLTPNETFKQTVEIGSSLLQGDLPEFPTKGIDPEVFVGNNLASFAYPLFVRQISRVFNEDDTVLDFKVLSFERRGDGLFVRFSFQSFYGLVFETNVVI
jgi:hypothetical protein